MSAPMTQDQFLLAYAELEAAYPLIYRPAVKKAAIAKAVFVFEITWFHKIINQIIREPARQIDIVKAAEAEYKSRNQTQRTKNEIAEADHGWKFLLDKNKDQIISQFGGAKTAWEATLNLLKQKKGISDENTI